MKKKINNKKIFLFRTLLIAFLFLVINFDVFATPVTTGLQLWLDASDATTITADASNRVSQWRDKSVNARHANQASNGLKPYTSQYTQNTLNVLAFTNDRMAVSGSAFSTTEMFFVFRTIYPYYTTTGCILCRQSGAYAHTYITSTSTTFLQTPLPTSMERNTVALSPPTFNTSPTQDFQIVRMHPSDDTSDRLYDINDRDNARDRYLIGEILAYNGTLTAVQELQIHNYLANKWGIDILSHTKYPASSSQSIGLTDNLTLSFSEPVFVDNGTMNIRRMVDDSLFEAIDLTTAQVTGSGTATVTINPSISFANDTDYYVEFPAGKIIGMTSGKQFGSIQDRYMWRFKTERAAPEDFNPRHLDGLELWLDASDAATISTSGTRVTDWRDKSGNERDAYQTSNSYRPDNTLVDIYGQVALYFHDRFMNITNGFFKSGTTIQVFRNVRPYFYNRSGAILGEANSSFRANYIFDDYRTYFLAPYPAAVIKDTTTITPAPFDLTTTDEWMILTVDTPYLTQKPQQVGTRWSTSYRSQNQIAEVISYNRYLSATEKRQVVAYLQKKWQVAEMSNTKFPLDDAVDVLTTDTLTLTFTEPMDIIGTGNIVIRDTTTSTIFETIPVNGPLVTGNGTTTITINPTVNFTQARNYQVEIPGAQFQGETTGYYYIGTPDPTDWDFYVPDPTDTSFDPTKIAGCELWLDASDTSTITLSGTRVTDWADKSGRARDAYQTNNSYRPDSGLLSLDGKNVLTFHERYMHVTNGDFVTETIIQVFRNTYPQFRNRDGAIVGKRYSYDTDTYAFQTNQTYFRNAPYPQRVQKNSVEITTPSFDLEKTDDWMVLTIEQAFADSHREIEIGSRQDTSYRSYQQIAEVVVYNRKLTSSELQQVTNYLQNKWKVGGLTHTVSPLDGEVDIATTDNLVITFSETVDVINGDITIYNLSTGAVHEVIDMTTAQVTGNGTTTITINPSVNFATDTDYAVDIPSGKITGETSGIDFAGKKSIGIYDWKFRTTNTGAFTPREIRGLELWLDAADTSTQTLSGNYVTDWDDKSNKGRYAYQTNNSYRGYVNTVTKNDENVIRFYDDYMFVNGEDFVAKTIIQVFNTPYPYFWNRSGAILGRNTNRFTPSYRFQANQTYFNNAPYPESVRKDYSVVTGSSFDLAPMGEWMVLTVVPNYKNSSRDYVVNSMDGGGNRFYNDIAEIIVYNGDLTDAELALVHNYLNQKWHIGGLQATLDPLDGAVNVSKTTDLTMTFTENVDLLSGELYLRLLSDGSLVDNLDILGASVTGNGTNTIVFDIPNLANGTDYYVEFDQGSILGMTTGLTHIGFNNTDDWNFRTINTGSFSPLDVQGIQLWFDASDAATITATGSKVTNWTDKSGRGRNASQTNASYRCDTGLYTQNGLNVMYCDRGYMNLANGTFLTGDIYAVYRSHENYFYRDTSILGRSFPDLSETFRFLDRGQTYNTPFPKEVNYSNKAITQSEITTQGGIRHMRDWKNMMVHPSQDTMVRDHKLGARWTGVNYDGRYDLAEVIAYDNAVSNGEKLQIFQYLANKWHIGGPELVSSTPAADAVDVSTSTSIQLVFDEAVDLVSGDLNIRRLSDDVLIQNLPLSGATGNGTTTINFSPAAFVSDEEFYLELAYGQIVSDLDRIKFPGFDDSDDLNFRTTDTDANFSPEDISNLKVWLDANDPAGLTLDANGFLQRWIDKSGHGNDFTQLTTPANRPAITASDFDFNNKTVVTFDDSNDGLRSDYDLRYPYTVLMVVNAETNPQGNSRILQGRDISWLFGFYNTRWAFYNEGWVNYDAADTITDNSAVLLSGYTNVNESMFYINGTLQTQNSTYRSSPGFLSMGSEGYSNAPIGGDVAEILVYDRDLTLVEIGQIEAYLSVKWGLSVPLDHVTLTPPDDSSAASLNGDLMIEFNRNIDAQFGTFDIYSTGNGNLFESISLTGAQVTGNGTSILTIDPTNNLEPLTAYHINITANGIADFSAELYPGISDTTTWNFVTDSTNGKFSPKSLPGLELWLDASDYSTLSIDGSNRVSRWDDKSDNARFANQGSAGSRPYTNRIKRNGFNTIEFRYDHLNVNESDFSAEDIYHVYRSILPAYGDYGSVLGSTSTSSAQRPYLFQSGNTYIHTNPNPNSVLVNNVALASPHYHEPIDELKTMTIRPRFPYVAARNYRIGASGSYDAPVEVADLVVYNRQLTDPERAQLHDYFNAKWFGAQFTPVDDATGVNITDNLVIAFTDNVDILTGNLRILDMETDLTVETINLNSALVTGNGTQTITVNPAASLATDTSYYVEIDSNGFESLNFDIIYKDLGGKRYWNFRTTNTTGSFDPRDIQGIELWYDAADNTTITEAGNLISNWADKSGYSRDASSSGNERPWYNQVQLNGLDVVQSLGDSMNFSDNIFRARTEFTVKRMTTPTYSSYGAVLGRQCAGFRTYLYYSGRDYFYPDRYPDEVFVNNTQISPVPYAISNLDEFFIQSITIDRPYDPDRYYRVLTSCNYNINQEVGEVILYNRDLSTAERNQVYDYLFNKWIGVQPISFDPPDDSAGVLVGDNLDVLFGTNINIANGDLRLFYANGTLAQTVDLNWGIVSGNGTSLISVDLPTDMNSDTDYYVEIDTGSMLDSNGNQYLGISDNTTWNFRTETTGPFDPRDIGGLQLWLDAQDASTITADGSNRVDTWLDKSGQSRHATMTNNSYKPLTNVRDLNGFNTMYFRDDYMDLANSSFVAGDIFVLMRDLSDRHFRYAGIIGPKTGAASYHHRMYYYRTDFYPPYPAAVWKDSRVLPGTTKDMEEINDYMLLMIEPSAVTTRDYYLNREPSHRAWREVAEVLVYNRVLSDSERIQVVNYMNDKWRLPGLKLQAYSPKDDETNIAVNTNLTMQFDNAVDIQNGDITIWNLTTGAAHEVIDINSAQVTGNGTTTITIDPSVNLSTDTHYCVFADNGLLFDTEGFEHGGIGSEKEWNFVTVNMTGNLTPLDVQGLELWLDAADTGTINIASGSNIDRWDDKTGFNHYAYQTTSSRQPQTGLVMQNNLNVLNFPGGDYLTVDNGFKLKAVDVFELYRSKTPDFNTSYSIVGTSDSSLRTYYFRTNEKTYDLAYTPNAVYKNNYLKSAPLYDLEEIDQFMEVEVQPVRHQRVHYRIGARETTAGQSEIGEVLIYNRILDDSERDIVSRYLQNKWHVGGPEVDTLDPIDGAIDVSITSNLTMTFTENVFIGNGDVYIRNLGDNSLHETIDINSALVTGNGTTTILMNPSLDFNNGGSYYIEIDENAILNDLNIGIKGFSGNSRWNFNVEEPSDITFDCRDVPGLLHWLDAADNGTITYAAGSLVSQWDDKSGYDRHVSQSTASLQPDHSAISLNGLRTLRFTGDSFDTVSNGTYQAVDIYQVYRSPSATFSNWGQALSNPTGTIGYDYRFQSATSYFGNSPYPAVYIKNYNVMPSYDLSPIDEFHAILTNAAAITDRPHAINNATGTRLNLDIAEICVYDRTLNGSEQQAVFRYFNHKWDVSGPEPDILTPLDDSTSGGISANMVMQFNRPINIQNGFISIYKGSDDSLFEAIDVQGGQVTGNGTTTIQIDPTVDFEKDTDYYVRIDKTAFDDIYGFNYFGILDNGTWNFRTINSGWLDSDWGNRIEITVPASSINSDLTDFPVYLDLSTLPASFFAAVNSEGKDIRVTTQDGLNALPREVVFVNTGANTGEVYFKAPYLSSVVDNIFYLYYGNANGVEPNPANEIGSHYVWSNGYAAVYHMQEDPGEVGALVFDSTSNINHLNVFGSMTGGDSVTGFFGQAIDFDGSNDYLLSRKTVNTSGEFSISAWVRPAVLGSTRNILSMANGNSLNFSVSSTGVASQAYGSGAAFGTSVNSSGGFVATGSWTHLAVSRTAGGTNVLSSNGNTLDTQVNALSNSGRLVLASSTGASNYFSGRLDEIRLSNRVRSNAWLRAEYLNLATPGTFYSTNTPEALASFLGPIILQTYPRNKAKRVPIDRGLTIEFNQAVNPRIGFMRIRRYSDDSIFRLINLAGTAVSGAGTSTITIDIGTNLEPGVDYYVEIDIGGFEDLAANRFVGIIEKETWVFRAEGGTNNEVDSDFNPN